MAQEPKYQKNMFLPVKTVEQILSLKDEYGSETAVVIAAVEELSKNKPIEISA